MKVTLESTDKIVTLVVDGKEVPARVWEGLSDGGVWCHAFITRIAVRFGDDHSQFERDLLECRTPCPEVAAIPSRLVINPRDGICEPCEGTGRIECEPDSPHTHPCDTCQPAANKEFQRGVEYGIHQALQPPVGDDGEPLSLEDIARMVATGEIVVPDLENMTREELLEQIKAAAIHHNEHHTREDALTGQLKRLTNIMLKCDTCAGKLVAPREPEDGAAELHEVHLHNIAVNHDPEPHDPAGLTTDNEPDQGDDDNDCWNCGGSGTLTDTCTCGDDTCCCLEPEEETCGECKGTGAKGGAAK